MTKDELARLIVEDYLRTGPEFLDVTEAADEEDFHSDADFEEIYDITQRICSELLGYL